MKAQLNLTIEPKIKRKAKQILDSEGKKLSSVIELYLKKLIEENGKK